MPKLLKEVWKTFFGSFFETEEEAALAEIHYKTDAAVTSAFNEAIKEFIERDEKAKKAYDLAYKEYTYNMSRCNFPPDRPSYQTSMYRLPPKFHACLLEELKKSGVLADPVLESKKER